MAESLHVTIDEWIFEAIEQIKKTTNRSRSETVNELLAKALLFYGPLLDRKTRENK